MSESFPRILKMLRKEKHISQREAAEQLGVSQALLSHYEKGIRECKLDFVVKVADYYNVSCDYLLGISDAYLPIVGEVLDKDIVEFFNLYQQLNSTSAEEARNYVSYLIYKQENQ